MAASLLLIFLTFHHENIFFVSNDTESSWGSDKGPQAAVLHRFEGIFNLWSEVYSAVDQWRHVGLLGSRLEGILRLRLIGFISRSVFREYGALFEKNTRLLRVVWLSGWS